MLTKTLIIVVAEDDTGYWWLGPLVAGIILLLMVIIVATYCIRRRYRRGQSPITAIFYGTPQEIDEQWEVSKTVSFENITAAITLQHNNH